MTGLELVVGWLATDAEDMATRPSRNRSRRSAIRTAKRGRTNATNATIVYDAIERCQDRLPELLATVASQLSWRTRSTVANHVANVARLLSEGGEPELRRLAARVRPGNPPDQMRNGRSSSTGSHVSKPRRSTVGFNDCCGASTHRT